MFSPELMRGKKSGKTIDAFKSTNEKTETENFLEPEATVP